MSELRNRAWDGRSPGDVPAWRQLRTDLFLTKAAHRRPGKEAIRFEGRSVTYAELDALANRAANGLLAKGLRPGEVVGVIAGNEVEVLAFLYGIARAGLAVLPMNPRYTRAEIEYQMTDAGAAILIAPGHVDIHDVLDAGHDAPPDVEWREDSFFQQRFTSGTTGKPKQVATTNRAVATMHQVAAMEFGYRETDVALVTAPLAHAAFHIAASTIVTGGTIVLARSFDAETIWRTCDEHGVTTTFMVPTMFALSLDAPGSGRSIRSFLSMSAIFPLALKKRVHDRFPGAELFDCYGATELGLVTLLRGSDPEDKQASVGRPAFGYEVRVLDGAGQDVRPGEVGEIYARGPGMSFGYIGAIPMRDGQVADGFLSVGDLGWVDEDGYLHVVDRRDDMIVSGGMNVYPAEVEEVLLQVQGVREVAVVGTPDDTWGHMVVAVVVGSADPKLMDTHCRAVLAGYKVPKRYECVKELPRNLTGKVLRRLVREQLAEKASTVQPVTPE